MHGNMCLGMVVVASVSGRSEKPNETSCRRVVSQRFRTFSVHAAKRQLESGYCGIRRQHGVFIGLQRVALVMDPALELAVAMVRVHLELN